MNEDNLVGRMNVTRDNLAPLLKEAREAKGLTLEEVADRLKIRPSLLEQIEAGKYESLPEMIYTRAYIQKFAQIVGLAPEPFVVAYERIAANANSPTLVRSASRSVIESAPLYKQDVSNKTNLLPYVLAFFGVLIIGVLAFFLIQGRFLPRSNSQSVPNVGSTIATTPLPTAPQADTIRLSVSSIPSGATVLLDKFNMGITPLNGAFVSKRANRELRVVKAGFKPFITTKDFMQDMNLSVTLERLPNAGSVALAGSKVQLIYRGSSWTRVRDATGKVIFEGQPKPGERLEFTPPFEVRLGQPSVVSAVVNGQTRERLGGSSPITVKFP
jgi:cytoskeleton protein RodZ